MGEAEFIARVCERADCGLMLDVNNAYVNATNFGFDIDEWMRTVPLHRVVQMHVAGHEWFDEAAGDGRLVVDTHGAEVGDPVLSLLGRVLPRTGRVPVVLERDQAIPTLDGLLAEVAKIRAVYDRAFESPKAARSAAAQAPSAEQDPPLARGRRGSARRRPRRRAAPRLRARPWTASSSASPPRSRSVIAAASGVSSRTCTACSSSR